jgi:amidohydrolase
MIEAGVMDNPPFEAIFTLHLMAHFPDGTVAVKPGNASTSSVSFTLMISGTGGHVGSPHKVINPVLLAGTVITATQALLPKKIAPGDPMIFEFAAIHGGTVGNIVPDEVTLKGSIRVPSPEKRDMMTGYFENMIRGIVEPAGGRYTLQMEHGYPTIYNHPDLIPLWQEAAAKIVGEENVILHDQIIPGGDDAAFFQQKVPGVYWMLGIRNEEKGFVQPLHSPRFDFNEDVLAIGAAIQVQTVADYLG